LQTAESPEFCAVEVVGQEGGAPSHGQSRC
jgi:hypothetical protein